MQRDIKIGLFAGLLIAGIAMVYICTRSSLSPRARILGANHSRNRTERAIEDEFEPGPIREQDYPAPIFGKPVESTVRYIEPIPQPRVEQPKPIVAQQSRPKSQPEVQTPSYVNTKKIKATRFYIVRRGDTLSKISQRYYGSANNWRKIYEANRSVLNNNPNLLKLGTKLIIPD